MALEFKSCHDTSKYVDFLRKTGKNDNEIYFLLAQTYQMIIEQLSKKFLNNKYLSSEYDILLRSSILVKDEIESLFTSFIMSSDNINFILEKCLDKQVAVIETNTKNFWTKYLKLKKISITNSSENPEIIMLFVDSEYYYFSNYDSETIILCTNTYFLSFIIKNDQFMKKYKLVAHCYVESNSRFGYSGLNSIAIHDTIYVFKKF